MKPGSGWHNLFNSSIHNLLSVTEQIPVGDSGLTLLKIPPVSFDSFTYPANLTDCSGESKVNIGDVLTVFGFGEHTATSYAFPDSLQAKCFEVEENSASCSSTAIEQRINSYFCGNMDYCFRDFGAPVMAFRKDIPYVASLGGFSLRVCNGQLF